ncbi:MAG: iron-sulfur cluster assembly scaffold protein [Bacteroidetes bacterium]|nr:iron-sulfur cluster assembly scaffold protein [Bacteroidota bacterium]
MKKISSKIIVEHLAQPKNFGKMTKPDGAALVIGQCGDTMEMYIKINDGKITEVLFYTDGCKITTACGSIATEMVKGQTIKNALKLSPANVIDKLHDLLGSNVHCAILAVTTLHKALADYLLKRGL